MGKYIFTLPIIIVLAISLAGCKISSKEQIVGSYKFRQNAVSCQTGNLVDDIAQTYTDKDAVMYDLDIFIRKNPRVDKVSLASVPMAVHPFSISLTEVQRAAPNPIGKHTARKRFNRSENMIWYRKLLRKQVPYWYQSKQNAEEISYVYPVFKELEPAVVLYVLKIDFDKRDNPVLFWNVPKKFYAQELLKQEKEYIKKYLALKEEAEQKVLSEEEAKAFKEAKAYYDLRFKELKETGKQREMELKQLKRRESK